MDIIVKTKNCEVPGRVKDRAVERVEHASRVFDRLSGVDVVFSEEVNPRIPEPAVVEVTAHAKGIHIRAQGTGADHHIAIDEAVARFERQLRRYKTRLVDRTRRHAGRVNGAAAATAPAALADGGGDEDEAPRIVRRKQFDIAELVVEDAALQLELLGHDFFVFTNAATGRCNVIYRRRDGDLGLIEPM